MESMGIRKVADRSGGVDLFAIGIPGLILIGTLVLLVVVVVIIVQALSKRL